MDREPIPQPCQAAGVEVAVVIGTAECESCGREKNELESTGRNFVGACFPLVAAVAADVTQVNLAHVVLSAPTEQHLGYWSPTVSS